MRFRCLALSAAAVATLSVAARVPNAQAQDAGTAQEAQRGLVEPLPSAATGAPAPASSEPAGPLGAPPTAPGVGAAPSPSVPSAPARVPGATTPASRTAAAALERARAAYEYGEIDVVVESARLVAEGGLRPTPAERVHALRLLGIGLFLTGRVEGAEATFYELLRLRPSTKLDPTTTRPDVVAFFEDVRRRHDREISAARVSGKKLWYNFFPPAGQFQNDHPGRGWAIAGVEILLVGTAIATNLQLQAWRQDGNTFGSHTDDARALRVVNWLSVGLLAATYAVGVIDGIVGFGREPDDAQVAWSLGPDGLHLRF